MIKCDKYKSGRKIISYFSASIIVTLCLYSCITSPSFSDIPTLSFISFDKSSMIQGDLNTDSILLTLEFTDGNGDIGAATNESVINLVVIDNRNDKIYDNVKLPEIPQDGANNGVKGTIFLKLFNGCCLFADKPNCTSIPTETNQLSFDIKLIDKAGNESNIVTTPAITLICQ